MNNQMEHFFLKKSQKLSPFSVCIVDEASQCVEPEMLIPFKLGFKKLVMIGDPEQLPGTRALELNSFCALELKSFCALELNSF
jgi:senataxin